jgi:hypothetical protein
VQLSRKLLSWLFRRPMAKRQPSKPELRSITPNMRIPSEETAYSSRTAVPRELSKQSGVVEPKRFLFGTNPPSTT